MPLQIPRLRELIRDYMAEVKQQRTRADAAEAGLAGAREERDRAIADRNETRQALDFIRGRFDDAEAEARALQKRVVALEAAILSVRMFEYPDGLCWCKDITPGEHSSDCLDNRSLLRGLKVACLTKPSPEGGPPAPGAAAKERP